MKVYDFCDYTNVIIVGDIHDNIKEFKQEITKFSNTVIICTGDLNIGYYDFEYDLERLYSLQTILSNNNNKLVIIRGNHDNPKYFKKHSTFINEIKDIAQNVYIAQDYSIINTASHNILCVGGARSIDRINKVKNVNWWQNENVQLPPENFYKDLKKYNISIDTIISHTAPLFAKPIEFSNKLKYNNSYIINSYAMYDQTLKDELLADREILKNVYEKLNEENNIKYYIYGHYHKAIDYTYGKTRMISLHNCFSNFSI